MLWVLVYLYLGSSNGGEAVVLSLHHRSGSGLLLGNGLFVDNWRALNGKDIGPVKVNGSHPVR